MNDRNEDRNGLARTLASRYADAPSEIPETGAAGALQALAAHRSHRDYLDRPVDPSLVRLLCAVALSAPSKSDLQQRDIVIIEDAGLRARVNALVAGEKWVPGAPAFLVFCGNNRRQRQLHGLRGHPFVNDHLDAFFNAAVDAGIALSAFITAAEAAGLGCCPVSAIRNRAQEVSDLLGLPDHVFPVAGLALGWPAGTGTVSPRLPLGVTVHSDRFREEGILDSIAGYDRWRAERQPYARQRYAEDFPPVGDYGWSEDKARQYSRPERAGFGEFVRKKGFDLG